MTGMLWFDPSPTPLADRIAKAAAYYARKYGHAPKWCIVPQGEAAEVEGVTVTAAGWVLPKHLWIGHEEE